MDFTHHVHRILLQMLQQFATDHCVKELVRIRKSIYFTIEEIDGAVELFAVGGGDARTVPPARVSHVSAPHFAIAQQTPQRRRNLHVAPEFQYPAAAVAGGYQLKG